MAKNTPSGKRAVQKKNDDTAVIKIMAAVVLLALSVYLMRMVSNHYATITGADTIYVITLAAAIAFGVLAAAALGVLLLVKQGRIRAAAPYVLAVSALYCLTAVLLRVYWMEYVSALTFLHVAVYCLYIVYMLYHTEFFLVSLVTVLAGGLFYR